MIGLPSETDDDVIGIVETTARVQEIGRRYLRGAKVTAAVSSSCPSRTRRCSGRHGQPRADRTQAGVADRAMVVVCA